MEAMGKFRGVVLRVFSPFLAVFVWLWRAVLLCVVVPSVSLARCLFGRRGGVALSRTDKIRKENNLSV